MPAVNENNIALRFLSSNFIVFTWEGIKGANEYEVIKERGTTRVSTTIRPKEITRTAQVMCSQFTKESNVLCYEDTVDSGAQYRFISILNKTYIFKRFLVSAVKNVNCTSYNKFLFGSNLPYSYSYNYGNNYGPYQAYGDYGLSGYADYSDGDEDLCNCNQCSCCNEKSIDTCEALPHASIETLIEQRIPKIIPKPTVDIVADEEAGTIT